MAEVRASAERRVAAEPEAVFAFLSDYRDARRRILTANYGDYRVEEGGAGPGTVVAYHFSAGRRERDYRVRVERPDATALSLRERDELSSFTTTWTVEPADGASRVTVESHWQGGGGIGGFFERRFAPVGLGRVYGELLANLERELSRQ